MAIHLVTGHGGTPHVTAADYGSFNASLVGTGTYIMDIGEKFGIEVVSNNSVRIKNGDVLFQGRHIRITGYEDLTVDNGTQGENRNDLIVLRYERNTATGVETATLRIAKGTAASSPVDPPINTGDIIGGDAVAEVALYRLPIAGITLGVPVLLIGEIGNFSGKADAIHTHTASDVGAAPTNHTHGIADVSGIVPVAQGGTGQATLAAARNAMGLGNTTGALPVANGGTGATSLASITVGNATKWNNYAIWQGTQAAYDAITSKSSTTIYFIVG